eukprot:TRINITY_DN15785_c0_g1_i1.p1 TRINITY_DN15785_c0_g1~~TRINITY_DN15785_c0_g1_i1.p1  ORF type:complete len:174 (+),score=34.73 TRINITY_DN15785_c0_g1_i1:175-696(+)
MFFHITCKRLMYMHPKYFGPNLRKTIIEKLHQDVEGTCSGKYGFIIFVTGVEDISMGKVQDSTGHVGFDVVYRAIVFRPFKNEIVDGVVTQVTKLGFFADVGPMQVFVSEHLIPADFKFDVLSNPPCFVSTDPGAVEKIEKDTQVRLKITGTRIDAVEIFSIGTLKEDFLGPI